MAIIFILIGMASCNTNITACPKGQEKILYDNEIPIPSLKVEKKILDEISNLALPYKIQGIKGVVYSLDQLQADGLISVVRFHPEKCRYYSVTPVEKGTYLLLLYSDYTESSSPYVIDGYLAAGSMPDKALFHNIIGLTKEEVRELDVSSCFFGDYSYHRFSDGSVLEIKYCDNQVSEYSYLNHPNVLDYLLPQDQAVINFKK